MRALISISFASDYDACAAYAGTRECCEQQHAQYYGTAAGATDSPLRRGSARTLADALFVASAIGSLVDCEGYDQRRIGGVIADAVEGLSFAGLVRLPGCTGWQTSAGNITAVDRVGATIRVAVAGVRHGIRWWPLGDDLHNRIDTARIARWPAHLSDDRANRANDRIRDAFPTLSGLELHLLGEPRNLITDGAGVSIATWSQEAWHPMDTLDDHRPKKGTTWFVTRHAGALEWLRQEHEELAQGARHVAHFDVDAIEAGDVVIGVLPVNLIADVIDRGAEYHHLSMQVPAEARGKELAAEDMRAFGARIERFQAAAL